MERRTQAIIGLAIAAMGIGLVLLAAGEDNSTIRYVPDVVAEPGEHGSGGFTLLGIPQPPRIPQTEAGGKTGLVHNDAFRNNTIHVVAWERDGILYHSTHTVTVTHTSDGTTWVLENRTREPGQAREAFPAETASWNLPDSYRVFLVQDFNRDSSEPTTMWAIYDGRLQEPMQPKPSQFEGRLLAATPGGEPLPDGVLVWNVETYTAGCSSKFLPPEAQEEVATEAAD